jgi:hypothetical protein
VLELDHLMVFLPGPEGVDGQGLVLDEGTRHVGQGTRNRRIVFPDSYVELLWVDSPAEAMASGLRFAERCAGEWCPFGVVVRTRSFEMPGSVGYRVPDGPTLQVLDDPRLPFLAVHRTDDLDAQRPARRMPRWVNGDTAIAGARLACGPGVPDVEVPGVSFVAGGPELRVDLVGRAPLVFRA